MSAATETVTEFRIVRTDDNRPDYIAEAWSTGTRRAVMQAELLANVLRDGSQGFRYSLQERQVEMTRTEWMVTP